MPLDFQVVTTLPAGALGTADLRRAYRNIVGGRVRRVLANGVGRIKARTPYPRIAQGYRVEQESGADTLRLAIVNDTEHWKFREYDTPAVGQAGRTGNIRTKWPPWGPGTPLEEWAERKGIPAYLVARKIAAEGTQGNHIVRDEWDDMKPRISAAVSGGQASYIRSYGQGQGGAE